MEPGPRDAFEHMMDEIAAASSVAELAWCRAEVARRFASHPRRRELDHLIDQMVPVVASRAGPGPAEE